MTKLTATLPGGALATRTTEHAYSHVLAEFGVQWLRSTGTYGTEPMWTACSWHHSLEAAQKAMAHKLGVLRKRPLPAGMVRIYEIVPVNP